MCGLAAIFKSNDNIKVIDSLLDELKHLEYRGYDSQGILLLTEQRPIIDRSMYQDLLVNPWLPITKIYGGIAHTRWSTHGIPCIRNTHPIFLGHDWYIIHNGIFTGVKFVEQALDYNFETDTDSERLGIYLIEYSSFGLTRQLKDLTSKFEIGAFILINTARQLYYMFTDGPSLHYDEENGLVSSDSFDKSKPLKQNKLISITPSNTDVLFPPRQKIKTSSYMQTEIEQQVDYIRNFHQSYQLVYPDVANRSFIGCGSSYLVGKLAAKYAAMAGYTASYEYATEAVNLNNNQTLYYLLSQSGETKDILDVAKKLIANGQGKNTIIVHNNPQSSLVNLKGIHNHIDIKAGPEYSVAATKTFTATLLNLYSLFFNIDEYELNRLANAIDALIKHRESDFKKLAESLISAKHIFTFGTKLMYPIASEGALKLKEVAQVHAEAMPASEIKHGPIALIEEGTPCIFFLCSSNEDKDRVNSNMEQIRSRGGKIIQITSSSVLVDNYFEHFMVENVSIELQPIVHLVAVQLLTYHLATAKGLNVDKPRSLSKSVTV